MVDNYNIDIEVNPSSGIRNLRRFDNALDKTDRKAKSTSRATQGIFTGFSAQAKLASVAAAGLGTVIGSGLGFSSVIRLAAEFETGLVGVAKTTNLAGRDLQALAADIDDLSRKIPVSTNELLELAESAGQLGITGRRNLLVFTRTIAQLGRTTDVQGQQAAQAIARLLNITGEAVDTVGTFGSVLVALGNNFATSESQILSLASEIARATAVYRVSSTQAAALATAMSSLGARSESAGSSVGRTFATISNAVNSGGIDLQRFAEISGISASEFTQAWNTNSTETFVTFLRGLTREGENAASVLADLSLGGVRLQRDLLPLLQNIPELERALNLALGEEANPTALTKEFEATLSTFDSQVNLLSNSFQSLGRAIGNEFLPHITEMIAGWTEWLNVASNRQAIIDVGIAIGKTAIAIAKLVDQVKYVVLAFLAFKALTPVGRVLAAIGRTILGVGRAIVYTVQAIRRARLGLAFKHAFSGIPGHIKRATGAFGKFIAFFRSLPGVAFSLKQITDAIGLTGKAATAFFSIWLTWEVGQWIIDITGLNDEIKAMGDWFDRATQSVGNFFERLSAGLANPSRPDIASIVARQNMSVEELRMAQVRERSALLPGNNRRFNPFGELTSGSGRGLSQTDDIISRSKVDKDIFVHSKRVKSINDLAQAYENLNESEKELFNSLQPLTEQLRNQEAQFEALNELAKEHGLSVEGELALREEIMKQFPDLNKAWTAEQEYFANLEKLYPSITTQKEKFMSGLNRLTKAYDKGIISEKVYNSLIEDQIKLYGDLFPHLSEQLRLEDEISQRRKTTLEQIVNHQTESPKVQYSIR